MAGAEPEAEKRSHGVRPPGLGDALFPIVVLAALLALSVYLFGPDSSYGPNQIVLITAAAVAAGVGLKNGHRWKDIHEAIVSGIALAMGAILILLAVGALIGTWSLSGTVPAMIYYGLRLLDPAWFYVASAIICALAAVATGSSWTTAGTLGIGLMGISIGLGLSPAATAGAIISGAYFGDKMSPLSDTTNLASAIAGTELFTHIRHMVWTTGPSFLITLVLFAILGLTAHGSGDAGRFSGTGDILAGRFDLSLVTLLPLALVLGLAVMRFPALPTILAGAVLGGLVAAWRQPELVIAFAGAPDLPAGLALTKGVWMALADGYVSHTGNAAVDDLLSRGGMSSFLNTIWLIVCALTFGAVMEHTGLLERIVKTILRAATGTGSLITAVVGTTVLSNIVASDQYMSIVVPGRMYREEFRRRGLKARNLSRTIEDAGTLTSPLVPWNTCGAYMSATLGVATLSYAPFCFLALINPFVAILYGWRGYTIERYPPGARVPAVDEA